jgi:polysaccharide export outer membrane protein
VIVKRSTEGQGCGIAVRVACATALVLGLAACQSASGPGPGVSAPAPSADLVNEQLGLLATRDPDEPVRDYRVGPGDVLDIRVFQAPELSLEVRIGPDGSVSYPLLGRFPVEGLTTGELERDLGERLGRDYVKNPQVSVFVKDYRAHPVSVLGEVNEPGVFYLREPRTILEMLSDAGGLTTEAGAIVQLRRRIEDPDTGAKRSLLVRLPLETLLEPGEEGLEREVRGGDTIFVPRAGVVYVEGAVREPGAHPLQGAGSVLKAVTLAGGFEMEAAKSRVQVIRAGTSPPEVFEVDFDEIRDHPERDVSVGDGDVVVVPTSAIKVGLVGLWRGVAGLVNVTKGF